MALNETLKQIDLTDIHRTFHSKAAEYKLFSITCGTFSRTVYMLGYKTSLNTFKKTETVLRIFFMTTMIWSLSPEKRWRSKRTCAPLLL